MFSARLSQAIQDSIKESSHPMFGPASDATAAPTAGITKTQQGAWAGVFGSGVVSKKPVSRTWVNLKK